MTSSGIEAWLRAAGLRHAYNGLTKHSSVGPCGTVAGVVADTRIRHWGSAVDVAVAVKIVIAVIAKELVVAMLELTALPSIDEERWVPLVQETDVLLASGGDAVYLCHWMRQSGLADLLPSLDETVWVGLSAGSMVMTPRIGDDFVGWKPPTGGDETLGMSTSRSSRTWITRTCRGTRWPTRNAGRAACRVRRTRSTTKPPSKWSTTPSTSSPRGTGNYSRPRTETCSSVLSLEGRSAPGAVSDLCQTRLTIVAHPGQMV
jgi:hypothetical protein